jgi:hypothetical protein
MLVRPAENNADGFGVQFLRPEPACVAISDHADVTNVTPSLRRQPGLRSVQVECPRQLSGTDIFSLSMAMATAASGKVRGLHCAHE